MSGTFMDGGGHDHGGHASHGGGGDGGGFMDGGHDHHHHGHQMHGSGGDGGNFLNHVLGYNNHNGHHSFLSHLLGLDHDAHHGGHGGDGGHGDGGHGDHGHDHHHHGSEGMNPSQTPIWTSALQGMKLSHALEGVKISINGWFAIFYILCILWLYFIYWLRHHEPLANQVLGRGAAKYETAAADQQIIDNVRDATPIRTSQNQHYYAPMPHQFHDPSAQQAIAAARFNPANQVPQPAFGPTSFTPPNTTPAISLPGISTPAVPTSQQSAPHAAASGFGTQEMASFYNHAAPSAVANAAAAPVVFRNANGPGHMIATPMPMAPGAQRLKMIINK